MRDDMFKVIVERPRLVNSNSYSRDGRKYRNAEDAPVRLGMKEGYGHTKWFNENLRPLERYLESQVNRPWDKVYSSIRAKIDARSTVKNHVLQHLDDLVAIKTKWEEGRKGGQVLVPSTHWSNAEFVPLRDSRHVLYVHPLNKLLLRNKDYTSASARGREKRQADEKEWMSERRFISDHFQLHRIDGLWYGVELVAVPDYNGQRSYNAGLREFVHVDSWDVVHKIAVTANARAPQKADHAYRLMRSYGKQLVYAAFKRQLSKKELRKYGLTNKAQSGLIFLGPRYWIVTPPAPLQATNFLSLPHFHDLTQAAPNCKL